MISNDQYDSIKNILKQCLGGKSLGNSEIIITNKGNITCHIGSTNNNKPIEFKPIELFDDPKLNKLVFDGLSGKPLHLARVLHYYFEKHYVIGEGHNWYAYKNHKWFNIGKKNNELRYNIHTVNFCDGKC